MTEQQPYVVTRRESGFEVRRYPEHLLAEVSVSAPFEDAGNRAFRYLFSYISGANRSRSKVAMTSPVVQQPAAGGSSEIAMTAPVVQQATSVAGEYRVAFVLPAGLTLDTAPEPTDPAVRLRVVPESTAAALRFSAGGRSRDISGTSPSCAVHSRRLASPRAVRPDSRDSIRRSCRRSCDATRSCSTSRASADR